MSGAGGHGPDRIDQTDALWLVAAWLDGLERRPVGTVEVRPDGTAWLHLEPAAGQPDPAAALRGLARSLPGARLEVDERVEWLGSRPARRLLLRPGLPVDLTLWCYETVPAPAAVAR